MWSFKLFVDCAYYFNKHIGVVAMPYIEKIVKQPVVGTQNTRYEENLLLYYPQSKMRDGGMWFYGVDLGIEYRF